MKSTVRIDDDLMQFVVDTAKHNGVSIQFYLNNLLEKGIIKEIKALHDRLKACKTTNPWEKEFSKIDIPSKDDEFSCPQFGYDQAVRDAEQGT